MEKRLRIVSISHETKKKKTRDKSKVVTSKVALFQKNHKVQKKNSWYSKNF